MKLTPPRIVEIVNPDPEQTVQECDQQSATNSTASVMPPSCSGLASSSSREPTEQSTTIPPPCGPCSETCTESDSSEMFKSQVTHKAPSGDGHPTACPESAFDVTQSQGTHQAPSGSEPVNLSCKFDVSPSDSTCNNQSPSQPPSTTPSEEKNLQREREMPQKEKFQGFQLRQASDL